MKASELVKLTEGQLIKFGFKKVDDQYVHEDERLALKITLKINPEGFVLYAMGRKYLIEYVHDVQNLYSALTGKELIEIK